MSEWVVPEEEHKKIKGLLARNPFEDHTFEVEWNGEWGCWSLFGRKHILVAVSEVKVDCNDS